MSASVAVYTDALILYDRAQQMRVLASFVRAFLVIAVTRCSRTVLGSELASQTDQNICLQSRTTYLFNTSV